jgi:DNA-binding transcriptional LysR family regulator
MIEELRGFLLVVEHGTVTRAARYAHLSQPALSASLARLESYFGTRLLHRGRSGATPTAAGTALVPRARAVLAALGDARRAVSEIEGLAAGEVRIGASGTAATYLLPPVLAEFRRKHPELHIVLREVTSDEAAREIERGQLDLAIVSEQKGELWRRDAFVLVGSPRKRQQKNPAFLTFLPGTSTRKALDRHFPDAHVVMELSSIAAVKRHVRQGVGVALISRAAVETELAQKTLIELTHRATPIPRVLVLLHRGADLLTPAAAALRALLLTKPRAKRQRSRR